MRPPRFDPPAGRPRFDPPAGRITEFASEKGLTPAQLALAWALHQGVDVVPIVGTKRVQYLEEDLAAADVCLSAAELAQVTQGMPEPVGDRYDPGGMRTVGI